MKANYYIFSYYPSEYKPASVYPETLEFDQWGVITANSEEIITWREYEEDLLNPLRSKDVEVKMISILWCGITNFLDSIRQRDHELLAKKIGITYEISEPETNPDPNHKTLTAKVTGKTGTYIIVHEIIYNPTFQTFQPYKLFGLTELNKNAILEANEPHYHPHLLSHVQKYFTPEEWEEIMFEKNMNA